MDKGRASVFAFARLDFILCRSASNGSMSQEITYHGTREDLRRLLFSILGSLAGQSGEFAPYVSGIKLRIGMVALAAVQEAFIEKSMGGTGEDGIKWKPNSPYTIANRALGPGDKKLMAGYGSQNGTDKLGRIKRGFLTPQEDERWRMLYGTRRAWLMAKFGLSEPDASARAAQIAWATLKSEGAKTKLSVLGSRTVAIGRDSGRLFNSLSPGTSDPEGHAILTAPPEANAPADRILREEPGAIVVGSNVEYASEFAEVRPLWPDGELPTSWNERIAEAARSGIEEAVEMIMAAQAGRRVA